MLRYFLWIGLTSLSCQFAVGQNEVLNPEFGYRSILNFRSANLLSENPSFVELDSIAIQSDFYLPYSLKELGHKSFAGGVCWKNQNYTGVYQEFGNSFFLTRKSMLSWSRCFRHSGIGLRAEFNTVKSESRRISRDYSLVIGYHYLANETWSCGMSVNLEREQTLELSPAIVVHYSPSTLYGITSGVSFSKTNSFGEIGIWYRPVKKLIAEYQLNSLRGQGLTLGYQFNSFTARLGIEYHSFLGVTPSARIRFQR